MSFDYSRVQRLHKPVTGICASRTRRIFCDRSQLPHSRTLCLFLLMRVVGTTRCGKSNGIAIRCGSSTKPFNRRVHEERPQKAQSKCLAPSRLPPQKSRQLTAGGSTAEAKYYFLAERFAALFRGGTPFSGRSCSIGSDR